MHRHSYRYFAFLCLLNSSSTLIRSLGIRSYCNSNIRLKMTSFFGGSDSNAVSDCVDTLQIGLTGSIGMGKSSISKQFIKLGFQVFDADGTVHKLYSSGGAAVEPIRNLYPEVINLSDLSVNRTLLAQKVLEDSSVLKQLELIVHPLVQSERKLFYEKAKENGEIMVIYDIPLLLENPLHNQVDYIIVVTASSETQRQRVLSRPNMSAEKFENILSKQLPDAIKRERAHYIINTDYEGFAQAKHQMSKIIENIIEKNPKIMNKWKSKSKVLNIGGGSIGGENIGGENIGGESIRRENIGGESVIAKHFDMFVFDLDDTLVPLMGPITDANDALNAFMKTHMPVTYDYINKSDSQPNILRETMVKISEENPFISHDVTELRRQSLLHLTKQAGNHEEIGHIEDALNLFITKRSNIMPYLYSDVIPCLQWLKEQNIKIGISTNGNAANLTATDVLGNYVDIVLSATDVGSLKPSPVPFISISQLCKIPTNRILFIGDSLHNDIFGATNMGMHSAHIARDEGDGASKYTLNSSKNDHLDAKTPFISLKSLHPSEFREKIVEYIQQYIN